MGPGQVTLRVALGDVRPRVPKDRLSGLQAESSSENRRSSVPELQRRPGPNPGPVAGPYDRLTIASPAVTLTVIRSWFDATPRHFRGGRVRFPLLGATRV